MDPVIIDIRLIYLSRESKSRSYDCEVSLNDVKIKLWGIKSLVWDRINRVGVYMGARLRSGECSIFVPVDDSQSGKVCLTSSGD